MLLAANQDSGYITCFRRDEKTGRLEPEKAGISCPVPVCIVAHSVWNHRILSISKVCGFPPKTANQILGGILSVSYTHLRAHET